MARPKPTRMSCLNLTIRGSSRAMFISANLACPGSESSRINSRSEALVRPRAQPVNAFSCCIQSSRASSGSYHSLLAQQLPRKNHIRTRSANVIASINLTTMGLTIAYRSGKNGRFPVKREKARYLDRLDGFGWWNSLNNTRNRL